MNVFLERKTIRRFIIRFFIVFGLVELLAYLFPPLAYQAWLAQLLGEWHRIPVQGIFLSVNGIQFEISAFCTGLSTWGLFLGLLYGFSIPSNKQKIVYALLGWIIIFFLNIIRLFLIVYVGKTIDANAVELLHTLTWFAMSAAVMGGWYLLLCHELKTTHPQRVAAQLLREK